MTRSRIASVLLSATLVLGTGALTALPVQVAQAVGAPVMIDDFGGNRVGPRTVTPLPEPGASTTPLGEFGEAGGLATMTMNGNGNGRGGVRLDYALDDVDLTSEGNNTQFFLEFASIQRLPVQTLGETAAAITIHVTDINGVTGTYNTGISNIIGWNVVLNFSCAAGPPCFSPQPDFTHATAVDVEVRYPTNLDEVGALTAILDAVRTTPTGGVVPPPPTPVVSVPATDVFGVLGSSVTFTVAFSSNGAPAAVTHEPPSDIGLRAQDVLTRGTAVGHDNVSVSGGPATYQVAVGPLTTQGTVGIDIPEEVVTDAWGQDNLASSGTPTVTFRVPIPPTLDTTNPTPFVVGQPSTFQFESAGLPDPVFTNVGTPLPAGLTLDADGSLSGTPAPGTSGLHTITVRATNIAGTDTRDYPLVVREFPSITAPDSASFVVGDAGAFSAQYTGFPLPDLTVVGAPAWLTVDDDGAGSISFSGTPPAAAVGETELTLNAENVVGEAQQTITLEVLPVETTVAVTADHNPAQYGEPVTVMAAVSSPSEVPGSVQFGIDGVDLGDPVAVVDGEATSPPLTAVGGDSLPAGSYEVTADFVPDQPGAAPSSDVLTLLVEKADTSTTVQVLPDAVTAEVVAKAPGAGTPTGAVTFALDGTEIGEAPVDGGHAVLAYDVPNGQAASISATYSGDANFTTSADSVVRDDPRITAAVTSAQPQTRFGWYGEPVTVEFTCTVASAPLVRPCPDPVTLSRSAANRTIERTIHAADGGVATVAQQLHIDLNDPRVRVAGVRDGAVYPGRAPRAECIGRDRLAGIASCRISLDPRGERVRYRAVATDKAGNTSSAHGSYRVLRFFVNGAPYRDRAFVVRTGQAHTLIAKSADRPRYFFATPAPNTPFERGPLLDQAGHDRWRISITISPAMGAVDVWKAGVKTGPHLHVVRLRIIG